MGRQIMSARDQVARLEQWAAVEPEAEEVEESEKPSLWERAKKTWADRPQNGGFAGGRSAVRIDHMDPAEHAYQHPEPKRIPSPNPRFEPDSWEEVGPDMDDESGYNWGPVPHGIPEGHVHNAAQLSPQDMDKLMGEVGQGGFTFRNKPGDGPTSGTMVSLPREEGHEEVMDFSKGQRPTPENMQDRINRKDEVVQSDPGNYHGGWEEEPGFYHDISRNFQDPWEAAGYALKGKQKGVYDLDGHFDQHGEPSSVDTSRFLNDWMAKGGSRQWLT